MIKGTAENLFEANQSKIIRISEQLKISTKSSVIIQIQIYELQFLLRLILKIKHMLSSSNKKKCDKIKEIFFGSSN